MVNKSTDKIANKLVDAFLKKDNLTDTFYLHKKTFRGLKFRKLCESN